jgi:hypothetical protein
MGRWTDRLQTKQVHIEPDPMPTREEIESMELSKFAKRGIAIEIYSEVLGGNLWFCPDDAMATQIKLDVPNAVTYTVNELMELIKLQPNSDELIRINHAKKAFGNSRIIYSKLKKEIT